jgi:hypothetical protein
MYASLPGAQFSEENNLWVVPCDAEVNVTWTFGGKEIPIHPLDTIATGVFLGNPHDPLCYGLWTPVSPIIPKGLDGILGMAFCKS